MWSTDLKKPYNKMVFRKVISNRNKKTKIFIKKQFIKVNQTEIGEKTRLCFMDGIYVDIAKDIETKFYGKRKNFINQRKKLKK